MPRQIYQIAEDIVKEWKKPHYSVKTYLAVMRRLRTPEQKYLRETGRSIVAEFLANADTWRGPVADQLKQELQDLIKE